MILSADDGCASDFRLAELCKKYKVKCIFYWPVDWHSLAYSKGYKPLTYFQAQAIARYFEIGSHTISHRHLTDLPIDEAKYEIEMCKYILGDLFDNYPTKFAAPRGYTNPELTEFTLKHYKSQRLTKEKGLVHIHPDSGVNGNKPWRECINKDTTELWCHSHELDKFNLWKELEDYLESLPS